MADHPLLGSFTFTKGTTTFPVSASTFQGKTTVLLFTSVSPPNKKHPDEQATVMSLFQQVSRANKDENLAFIVVPLNTVSFGYMPNEDNTYTVKMWNDNFSETRRAVIDLCNKLGIYNQPTIVISYEDIHFNDGLKGFSSDVAHTLKKLKQFSNKVKAYKSDNGNAGQVGLNVVGGGVDDHQHDHVMNNIQTFVLANTKMYSLGDHHSNDEENNVAGVEVAGGSAVEENAEIQEEQVAA